MGQKWISGPDEIKLLPGCTHYLKLSALGEDGVLDAGSHAVAHCRVDEMLTTTSGDETKPHLSTARLRQLGIITKEGRVAD